MVAKKKALKADVVKSRPKGSVKASAFLELELSRETAQKLHLHYSQARAQAAALEQETLCNAL